MPHDTKRTEPDWRNLTATDWRHRGALSITEAAGVLGIGRTLAFDLVRRGELETIALGGRRVVAVSVLRRMLGEG